MEDAVDEVADAVEEAADEEGFFDQVLDAAVDYGKHTITPSTYVEQWEAAKDAVKTPIISDEGFSWGIDWVAPEQYSFDVPGLGTVDVGSMASVKLDVDFKDPTSSRLQFSESIARVNFGETLNPILDPIKDEARDLGKGAVGAGIALGHGVVGAAPVSDDMKDRANDNLDDYEEHAEDAVDHAVDKVPDGDFTVSHMPKGSKKKGKGKKGTDKKKEKKSRPQQGKDFDSDDYKDHAGDAIDEGGDLVDDLSPF